VWSQIITNDIPPSPRERHTAVIHDKSIFIFGGFNGQSKLKDFYEFNTETNTWQEVISSGHGNIPSARHSHISVVHGDKMYIFGGFDGNCKNDFYKFNFTTNNWILLPSVNAPKPRYLSAATVYKDVMFVFGGHNESHVLNDLHAYNFDTERWTAINFHSGIIPSSRSSHSLVTHNDSLYLFGGCTNTSSDYLYEYKVEESRWFVINSKVGDLPLKRYGHSAVINRKILWVFGGHDTKIRRNELYAFKFEDYNITIPKGTLINYLKTFINKEQYSDVTIILDGNRKVRGHKIFLTRIPYFQTMFEVKMKEAKTHIITLEKVPYESFLLMLQFIYTDECDIPLERAMELFELANRFGIERLKAMCARTIMTNLRIDNAANILLVPFYTYTRPLIYIRQSF